jgi:glycerate kinase
LRPGAQEIAAIAGLPAALEGADLVITGEGQYDETSGTGKVTGSVLAAAARAGVRSAMVAGVVSVPPPAGVRGIELLTLAGDMNRSLSDPSRWLAAAGRLLAVEQAPDGPIPAA